MTLTLTFGWWLIPFAITLWFLHISIKSGREFYGDYSFNFIPILCLIPILFVWMVYFGVMLLLS